MIRSIIVCMATLLVAIGSITAQYSPSAVVEFPQEAQLPSSFEIQPDAALMPSGASMVPVNSVQSGLWNAPGTWDCGCVPSMLEDVTINGTHVITLNMDANVNHLSIASGGSFVLEADAEYVLEVYGDWDNNGVFTAEKGTVTFTGTDDQNILGVSTFFNLRMSGAQNVNVVTDVRVDNLLQIEGSTLYPNSRLTLASSPSGNAMLDKITTGEIVGNLTVEKTLNPSNNGWLTVSAPFDNATIDEWNDNFITTGFIGADYPNYSFVSIQYWDETATDPGESFTPIDSSSQSAVSGLGYYIYANAGSYPFETEGHPIYGDFDMPIDFTDTGNLFDDGLNVLGNPYPCDINWDSETGWTKSNLNGAIYIWDVSQNQFRVYINGYGINGGSALIHTGEAFWVQANGSNPVLSINEEAKAPTWTTIVNTSDDFLKMSMVGATSTDQFIVAFNESASNTYESQTDAFKFFSDASVPNVATRSEDDINLSVNSLDLGNGGFTIPVVIHSPNGGDFLMTRNNFPVLSVEVCIAIEDLETGLFYDLASTASIPFTTEPVEEEVRFMIHVGTPITANPTDVACYGLGDGSIVAQGSGSGPWDYNWYDESDTLIGSATGETGAITIEDLVPGTYTIEVLNNDYCNALSGTVSIVEPMPIYIIDYYVYDIDCDEEDTGQIIVIADGGTGDLSYSWDNGGVDSTITDLPAGDYTLTLIDENMCELVQYYTINAAPSVTALFDTDTQVIDLLNGVATIEFENQSTGATTYEWDFGDGSAVSNDENPSHTYTETGVYIVMLSATNDMCSASYQIVVQVQEIIISVEETDFTRGISLTYNDGMLLANFSLLVPTQIEINGYSLLGQMIVDPLIGTFQNETVPIELTHRAPVGIITILNKDTGETKSFKVIH
jgi:hypothetical protein